MGLQRHKFALTLSSLALDGALPDISMRKKNSIKKAFISSSRVRKKQQRCSRRGPRAEGEVAPEKRRRSSEDEKSKGVLSIVSKRKSDEERTREMGGRAKSSVDVESPKARREMRRMESQSMVSIAKCWLMT